MHNRVIGVGQAQRLRAGRRGAVKHPPPVIHDLPWKEALEGAFPEFMACYFLESLATIDWSQGHDFLDQELRQTLREAAVGRLHLDLHARVTGIPEGEQWPYVHLKVQIQSNDDFARRMFTYNLCLMDRCGRTVSSISELASNGRTWRPGEFLLSMVGCKHTLRIPVAKLLNHEHSLAALKCIADPFALVTAAHLSALRTRSRMARHFAAKRQPDRGPLVPALPRRFGPLPKVARSGLENATPAQLDNWADRVLDAPTLDDVLRGH